MVEQGKQRLHGRFFGRRVNCERVPLLPTWAVARMLDDPREIPYLLVWKSRSDDTVQEAARIAPHNERAGLGGLDWSGAFEIKRHDGTRNFIRTLLRPLPRNGGRVRLLICPSCNILRRGLYGWEPGGQFTTSAVRSTWGCRKCNLLRYESEGGALVHRGRGAIARLLELYDGAAILDRHRSDYTETDVAQVKLAHRPGELGRAASRLGDAGININYGYCGTEPHTNATFLIFGIAGDCEAKDKPH